MPRQSVPRVVLLLAASIFLTLPAAVSAERSEPVVTLTTAEEDALRFRTKQGLSTDIAHIRRVNRDRSANREEYGVALTDAELADLHGRPTGQTLMDLRDYLADHRSLSGGLYIDQAAGGVVDVAWTVDPSSAVVAEMESLLPPGAELRMRRVAYAEYDLRAIQEELASQATRGTRQGMLIESVSTNIQRNVVRVGVLVDNVDRVARELSTVYPAGMVVVEIAEPTFDTACSRTDCKNPNDLRGGLKIYPPIDYCTSGFVVKNLTTPVDYYILSAGHCATIGNAWTHAGEGIGSTLRQSDFEGSTADALIINIPNDRKSNCIWLSSTTTCRAITGWQSPNADAVGDEVRKTGARTGNTTGNITDVDWDGNFGCCFYNNLVRADYNTNFGDSGAPVYLGNLAIGTNKGKFGVNDSAYSHIFYVLDQLDVTVQTSP